MREISIKRTTLKQQVYDFLKNAIILGEIAPGERLVEERISKYLNVSRSPIREAVRLLEKDGLLNVNASGGVTVVNPTIKDYQHLYEIRVEIESLAAYYAAERRNSEEIGLMEKSIYEMKSHITKENVKGLLKVNFYFHDFVVRASHNPYLESMVVQVRGVNSFYRKTIVEGNPQYVYGALKDHQKIFGAILNQESEKARKYMKEHIDHDYLSYMKAVKMKQEDAYK